MYLALNDLCLCSAGAVLGGGGDGAGLCRCKTGGGVAGELGVGGDAGGSVHDTVLEMARVRLIGFASANLVRGDDVDDEADLVTVTCGLPEVEDEVPSGGQEVLMDEEVQGGGGGGGAIAAGGWLSWLGW